MKVIVEIEERSKEPKAPLYIRSYDGDDEPYPGCLVRLDVGGIANIINGQELIDAVERAIIDYRAPRTKYPVYNR